MKPLFTFLAGVVVGLLMLRFLATLFVDFEPEEYEAVIGYPN